MFRQEQIQLQCDLTVTSNKGLCNPLPGLHRYTTINEFKLNKLDGVRSLFIYGEILHQLCILLPDQVYIENIYVGNGDENIYQHHIELFKTKFQFSRCYIQNLCHYDPDIKPLPIGLENSQWKGFKPPIVSTDKQNRVLLCVNPFTHTDRLECVQQLEQIGMKNVYYKLDQYTERLNDSMLCICPRGNGYDTHRFWEALYCKTIPVVKQNMFIDTLLKHYPNIPVIIVDDWTHYAFHSIPPFDFDTAGFFNQFYLP